MDLTFFEVNTCLCFIVILGRFSTIYGFDDNCGEKGNVTVAAGGTARFRCKVQRADSTFRWRKNGVLISVDQSERLEIRVRTRKGKSVGALIVRKASDSDSGCYSCETNGANQTLNKTSWRLDVTEAIRKTSNYNSVCGGPSNKKYSACFHFSKMSYPHCKSFPGKPLNFTVTSFFEPEDSKEPWLSVHWKAPKESLGSLWGYQIFVAGLANHAGYYECIQINNPKVEDTFWNFHKGLKAGATYEVFLQSMPAKNQNPGKNIESFRITTPEEV